MHRIGWLLIAALAGCGEPPTTPAPQGPRAIPAALVPAVDLINERRFDAARVAADAYLAAHPDDASGLFVKGLTFHRARDYARAEPLLVRALEIDPEYATVQHFLGYCRFYLGDLPGARRAFEAHLDVEPAESDSHFGLGIVALEEGRFDEARARIGVAIELIESLETTDPARYRSRRGDLAKCHARLGDIDLSEGAFETARDRLGRAIAIDPNLYAAYYLLSRVERRLGNEAEADRVLALFRQMAAARQRRAPEDGS